MTWLSVRLDLWRERTGRKSAVCRALTTRPGDCFRARSRRLDWSRWILVIKTRPLAIGEEGNVGFDVRGLDVFGKRDDVKVSDAAHRIRSAVDQHFELVWRSLRRFGVPPASADDAAQQVLMIFSRRINDIAPGAERAFLLSTAIRVAADHRRSQKRSREVPAEEEFDAHASSNLPPDALIDRARARQLLDLVLNELSDDLRVVFVLYELEEMTMRSIAETLALPAGTVASRLRRAREQFESIADRLRGPDE